MRSHAPRRGSNRGQNRRKRPALCDAEGGRGVVSHSGRCLRPPAGAQSAAAGEGERAEVRHAGDARRIGPGAAARRRSAGTTTRTARGRLPRAAGRFPWTQRRRAPRRSTCARSQQANRVRLARAELKRQVAEDETTVGGHRARCPWEAESMAIADLLMSQHRWGRTRCRRFLAADPDVGDQDHRLHDRSPARRPCAALGDRGRARAARRRA